jgi:hypothetical protein
VLIEGSGELLRTFKAATGLTFRRFKQWSALQHAARQIAAGELVRTAAMDAGLARYGATDPSLRRILWVPALPIPRSEIRFNAPPAPSLGAPGDHFRWGEARPTAVPALSSRRPAG